MQSPLYKPLPIVLPKKIQPIQMVYSFREINESHNASISSANNNEVSERLHLKDAQNASTLTMTQRLSE